LIFWAKPNKQLGFNMPKINQHLIHFSVLSRKKHEDFDPGNQV